VVVDENDDPPSAHVWLTPELHPLLCDSAPPRDWETALPSVWLLLVPDDSVIPYVTV
jgi:hypothetical protein